MLGLVIQIDPTNGWLAPEIITNVLVSGEAKENRAMALDNYLREEILEEAELGYISQADKNRILAAFDETYPGVNTILTKASANGESSSKVEAQNSDNDDADPNITTSRISVQGSESEIFTYLAKPKEGKGLAGVIVIHENKGITPHIEDVTRRLANEGFVAIAPDLLSRRGGTSEFMNSVDAITALKTIRGNELVEDLMSIVSYLSSDEAVDPEKIGVIGFCFGGGMAWRLATQDQRIKAAVPFYGVNPAIKFVPNIQASVLAIYGELDDRINAGIDEITNAMELNEKVFEKEIYSGAQHGFHNDTNPNRYHPEAAQHAWQRTLKWLRRWL